jgi:hypothetical protein
VDLKIKKLPPEVESALLEMKKRSRTPYVAGAIELMLRGLGGVAEGSEKPQRDPAKTPAKKFTPPTEAEADAEIAAKGYHFGTGKDFVAWYATRGWRTKEGPMKDWKQAMVTWESRWKGGQKEVKLQPGKLSSEEQGNLERLFAARRNV